MTITLPDTWKELLDRQVAGGRYPSAEAYVEALLHADLKKRASAELESLLVESLDSSAASEMSDQDWEDIRRDGLARIESARHR